MVSSFIITGFLGVGKTTLLTNTVKQFFDDKKIAIIVNEFGDVGVDSTILSNVHTQVMEISQGCICCKLSQEFESGVKEIIEKYDPEIIFVETSGASEPFPIFLSLQNLGITVEGIMCVIDGKNFHSYKDNSTAQYQIAGSNMLLLSKVDLVDEKQLKKIEEDVKAIKEEQNIKNILTQEPVFKNYTLNYCENGITNKEIFEGIYKSKEIIEFDNSYKNSGHTQKDSITQKVLYIEKDIEFNEIETLLKSLPNNIYRVKGVVKVEDVPRPLFINYAFGNFSFEEIPKYTNRPLLVFIGGSIHENIEALKMEYQFLES